jgi:hypothetical protein
MSYIINCCAEVTSEGLQVSGTKAFVEQQYQVLVQDIGVHLQH